MEGPKVVELVPLPLIELLIGGCVYQPLAQACERVLGMYGENRFTVCGLLTDVDEAWSAVSYNAQFTGLPSGWGPFGSDGASKSQGSKTGVEGYRVGLEVFHKLHCTNSLRQVTYRDWYKGISGEFKEGQKGLQMHTGRFRLPTPSFMKGSNDQLLDHYLEILRMNVQCNEDIGVFTLFMLVEDHANI
ncbi:hypothetical protein EAF04_006149 [Stromatinia cepivora]|nr:hypothetical protein EAF04_006149 [Stromatinia cepivora]